jgi:hypothetical protein
LNLVQKTTGAEISAAALQDTDGSASHPYQIFFEKALMRRQCHRYRKAIAAMSAIIF